MSEYPKLRTVSASAGSNFYLKQLALTHISENKKLIILNGDYGYGHFVEAFGGASRTLALEEYSLGEFLEAAAGRKPVCIDARYFEHTLVFATHRCEFVQRELTRVLETVRVDGDTLVLVLSMPTSPKAECLATPLKEFIESARAKGASVVMAAAQSGCAVPA